MKKRLIASSILGFLAAIGGRHFLHANDDNSVNIINNPNEVRELPEEFPRVTDVNTPYLIDGKLTTINPKIQNYLQSYINRRANPIAAVVVADIKTGKILAAAQGRTPDQWGGKSHTALHIGFPAASLFKTTVSSAMVKVTDAEANFKRQLAGGCAKVAPRGTWMREDVSGRIYRMSLKRAYGASCNGFFAKLAINELGLGPILNMANDFGWNNQPIPADFYIPASPFNPPSPTNSSAHTVGKFAAGFGYVSLSAMHSTWQTMIIANNGTPRPLKLFEDELMPEHSSEPVLSEEQSQRIRQIMKATVLGGTATSTFRARKFRRMRYRVGGKTGTLTGSHPKGLTTWFTGIYPIDKPEVVVSTVVLLDRLWHFKAADLAAEGLYAYRKYKKQTTITTAKLKVPPAKN